jgi:hypothetical protein
MNNLELCNNALGFINISLRILEKSYYFTSDIKNSLDFINLAFRELNKSPWLPTADRLITLNINFIKDELNDALGYCIIYRVQYVKDVITKLNFTKLRLQKLIVNIEKFTYN